MTVPITEAHSNFTVHHNKPKWPRLTLTITAVSNTHYTRIASFGCNEPYDYVALVNNNRIGVIR